MAQNYVGGQPYSFAQLQQLWTSNGGNPMLAPLAAAISIVESGNGFSLLQSGGNVATQGVAYAGSWNTSGSLNGQPTYAKGLWQINYMNVPNGENPFDPNTNAQLAVQLAGPTGTGFASNWSETVQQAQALLTQAGQPALQGLGASSVPVANTAATNATAPTLSPSTPPTPIDPKILTIIVVVLAMSIIFVAIGGGKRG